MKLKPYKEIIKMAKDKVDDALAPVRAHRAKKQAELKIAELEEKIASKEAKIDEMCCEKELNFDKIIDAQDELGLLERRKKQFIKLTDEMFPD